MKKMKFVLAALFAVAVAGTVTAQSVSDIQAKFTEAAAATSARDYVKATALFEEVIDLGLDVEGADAFVLGAKKTLPDVIMRNAMTYAQAGKMDEALAEFTRSAELAELYGNVTVLNNARGLIGKVVLQQGANAFNTKDYATAAAIFQKGYDSNPNDMQVALYLAQSYSGLKNFEKSSEIYKNIIALEGRDARFTEAVATAKENFTLDNLERASMAAQAGDFQGAIVAVDEMLAVLPGNADALWTRLQAYNSLADYAKVIELGDETIAAQTDEIKVANANYLVGIAYNNKENAARAIQYLTKVTVGPNAAAAKTLIPELQKVAAAGK